MPLLNARLQQEILSQRARGHSQQHIANALGLPIQDVQAVLRADMESRIGPIPPYGNTCSQAAAQSGITSAHNVAQAEADRRMAAAKAKKTKALRQLAEADAALAALG